MKNIFVFICLAFSILIAVFLKLASIDASFPFIDPASPSIRKHRENK